MRRTGRASPPPSSLSRARSRPQRAGDTILIAPGAYDQDLPARVGAARAANIVVAVVGG